MLFLGVVFQSLISFFLASIFNLSVIFFISFFAFVILNIEILSLFKGISGQNILILTFLEFLIVGFIWFKNKKIPSTSNFKGFLIELKNSLLADKSLLVLFLFWVFCIAISFILALLSPVNEPDAQGYHALRSLFWAKDGFISHFEIADIRCHSMPINSELFYVWILSLSKNDLGFGLLQFFSYFLLIISSFKIMEFYEIDFNKRIWSILIFSSFAGVISQISSTQTDLLVGSLLTTSFYLILEFKKQNKLNFLYFASLSMAISFGVKSTGIIASIPLLIWYIFLLRKEFIKYFLFLILNFSIFSSYNYILNLINYSSPLGAKSAINEHSLYFNSFQTFIMGGVSNLIRYIFSIFDFSGVVIFYLFSPIYDNLVHFVFNLLNINPLFNSNGEIPKLNAALFEHTMGLGVLSFLYVLPSSIVALFNKKLRPFVIVFVFQTVLLSFAIVYFPTTIRFFITFLTFLIPIFSIFYKKNHYKNFVTIIAFLYLLFVPLFMVQRPFVAIYSEFLKNPNLAYLMNNIRDVNLKAYSISKSHIFLKNEIQNLPKNSKVALIVSESFMGYPIKYLDFKNELKVDFLTFDKKPNLNSYNYIVLDGFIQSISTVNDFNETNDCKITKYMNRDTGKVCLIDEKYLINSGFIPFKKALYKANDFLKKTGNDEDKIFYFYKKY